MNNRIVYLTINLIFSIVLFYKNIETYFEKFLPKEEVSMLKRIVAFLVFFIAVFYLSGASIAAPKGAKALFDSGEGPAVGISAAPTTKPADRTATVEKQKYAGISYELLLLTDDGQIKKVSKNRIFRSGERLIMRVMTNRSGNLKIFNIGPTGKTTPLYDDYIEAFTTQQIPKGGNLRFAGPAGTETLIIMLSDSGMPGGIPGGNVTAGGGQPPISTNPGSQSPEIGSIQGQDYAQIAANNIDGAKRIKGAKDIVVEDQMQSSFAVVSPKNNWQPVKTGAKDIVVESAQGVNYGVVPVSALSDGGIFSLTVKLQHK